MLNLRRSPIQKLAEYSRILSVVCAISLSLSFLKNVAAFQQARVAGVRPAWSPLHAGFGGGSSGGKAKTKVPPLTKEAKDLLRQYGGDMNAAQSAFYRRRIQEEEERLLPAPDPAAGGDDGWKPVEQAGAAAEKEQALHEAKVIASWDAIATFLPVDYASQAIAGGGKGGGVPVDKTVARRLKMVAQACVPSGCDAGSLRVLDIRCGDGAAVPFIDDRLAAVDAIAGEGVGGPKKKKIYKKKSVMDPSNYEGIDVSPAMVAMAEASRPGRTFRVANFLTDAGRSEVRYGAVLFNGSLQFFQDSAATLSLAASILAPGGRIVLSHVQGGRFVRDEVRRNPMAGACREMPDGAGLDEIAASLGLRVLLDKADAAGGDLRPEDANMDDFYLAVLQS
mmetsp:Transcript_8997/g.18438  ORF Transcript_8997/g.18438 Transcript_8997/m.18438 type:complete len:393 (+) Transcript_8997:131-1309(+)